MSDYLIKLGQNQWATKAIKSLGLPIPLPTPLQREPSGWGHDLLKGHTVLVNAPSLLAEHIGASYKTAGCRVISPESNVDAETNQLNSLIFDLTGATDLENLNDLYSYFRSHVNQLKKCGRIIVICTSPGIDPINTTIAHACVGFVKSIAKEIGKRGATAHVVQVDPGAEDRLSGVLWFLSSSLSAYMSGQVFHVSEKVRGTVNVALNKPLAGKLALVTGAGRGIGYATAKALASEGATVVCLDVEGNKQSLDKLANYISGVSLAANITSSDVYERIVKAIPEKFSNGYDIIVHNAGITRDKTLAKMSEEFWHQVLDVNLMSVVSITDRLREKGLNDGAKVVCLSSTIGIGGNFGQTNYATSKAGVIGYVKALSGILAERGIAVNAVAPGFIETKMTASMPVALREMSKRFNALSQAGRPSDVADVITFLTSDHSRGLTGQVFRVCGLNILGA